MKMNGAGVDEKLSLMSKSRRRYTLYSLLSNEYANLDSLSVQIAAWEQDETIASVSEQAQESVKISLHHNHLPKLVEADIVKYDGRSGDIVRGDRFDEIESTVEQFRDDEGGVDESSEPETDAKWSESILNP